MQEEIVNKILNQQKKEFVSQSLVEMGINQSIIDDIYQWAYQYAQQGELANYIPELENVNRNNAAITIGDLHDNIISTGNALGVCVSIQSVIKPFLYIYALEKGVSAELISYIEPTAMRFNADAVLSPDSMKNRPGHPLNNAGAISSAGCIVDFVDFMNFMRLLTGNEKLDILKAVYLSEMNSNSNNRAIAYRLVASGRFPDMKCGERALNFYTKACSLGVTTEDITRACLVLARGGYKDGKKVLREDNVVRAINVMNTYGLYEHTAEISLVAAGVRALSCKSGVGGLIVNIDPGRGAFCTYSPCLDKAGNSVFGKYALILLNNLLSAPAAMRLSTNEVLSTIANFDNH